MNLRKCLDIRVHYNFNAVIVRKWPSWHPGTDIIGLHKKTVICSRHMVWRKCLDIRIHYDFNAVHTCKCENDLQRHPGKDTFAQEESNM